MEYQVIICRSSFDLNKAIVQKAGRAVFGVQLVSPVFDPFGGNCIWSAIIKYDTAADVASNTTWEAIYGHSDNELNLIINEKAKLLGKNLLDVQFVTPSFNPNRGQFFFAALIKYRNTKPTTR